MRGVYFLAVGNNILPPFSFFHHALINTFWHRFHKTFISFWLVNIDYCFVVILQLKIRELHLSQCSASAACGVQKVKIEIHIFVKVFNFCKSCNKIITRNHLFLQTTDTTFNQIALVVLFPVNLVSKSFDLPIIKVHSVLRESVLVFLFFIDNFLHRFNC